MIRRGLPDRRAGWGCAMIDEPLTVQGDYGGWWRIVRANHDGRVWTETADGAIVARCRADRLEPRSCVEGERNEMLGLALGILAGEVVRYKRCAAEPCAGGFRIYSPHNTDKDRRAVVSAARALDLAREIVARLGGAP